MPDTKKITVPHKKELKSKMGAETTTSGKANLSAISRQRLFKFTV
jgi:hypothetical protein